MTILCPRTRHPSPVSTLHQRSMQSGLDHDLGGGDETKSVLRFMFREGIVLAGSTVHSSNNPGATRLRDGLQHGSGHPLPNREGGLYWQDCASPDQAGRPGAHGGTVMPRTKNPDPPLPRNDAAKTGHSGGGVSRISSTSGDVPLRTRLSILLRRRRTRRWVDP